MFTFGSPSRAGVLSVFRFRGERSQTEMAPSARRFPSITSRSRRSIATGSVPRGSASGRTRSAPCGEGPPVPHASKPVHDLQRRPRAQGLDAARVPTKDIGLIGPVVGAGHVGETAVGDVLEAARDPGRPVVLHVGDVDDLGEAPGDEAHQVGARILLTEEVGLHVGVGVVSLDCPCDGSRPPRRRCPPPRAGAARSSTSLSWFWKRS